MKTGLSALPIDAFLPEILNTFRQHQNLVLVAEPGAGKTTRVPPALLELVPNKIYILEPRRMAAVAAATRIAEEQNFILGEEIGYQVRFESLINTSTRLIFMTEALLAKKILADPEMKDVGLVILDEFHERSQHVDLALGLLKESQELGSQVKILVMSATLNAERISQFLGGAPILRVPGKSYPLEIKYEKNPQILRTDDRFYRRLLERIQEAATLNKGDVLVFLPGVGEIQRVHRGLEELKFSHQIDVLHGALSLEEQRRVLAKSTAPRVILSTNIAESSVTLDGVGIVIDSGLNKINSWNPDTGFNNLELQRVSLSSAAQRAGRAARQGPGLCFKLWNPQDELSMKAFTEAEILRVDLADALLWLSFIGVRAASTFSWYETPPQHHLRLAHDFLFSLKVIDSEGGLTKLGERVLSLPLDVRLAHLFAELDQAGFGSLAADYCALLQERDVWARNYDLQSFHEPHENDLQLRWELMNNLRRQRTQPGYCRMIFKASEQLSRFSQKPSSAALSQSEQARFLLHSYPDRICRRREPGSPRALMATGRGVELDSTSLTKASEFFIALTGVDLNSKDTKINWAAPITKEMIISEFPDEIEKRRELRQDPEKAKVWVEEFKCFRKIPLEKPIVRSPSAEELESILPDFIFNNWDQVIKKNDGLAVWFKRWKYYVTKIPSADWTEKDFRKILVEACYGQTSIEQAFNLDWSYFFESHLSKENREQFRNWVPSMIQIGSRVLNIQYELGQDPCIESRIQNFYGLKTHPSIWQNQVPLRLILLGPHGRPIQITKDLPGFWKSSYPEIRKEMRMDYPKHKWPEDPSDFI